MTIEEVKDLLGEPDEIENPTNADFSVESQIQNSFGYRIKEIVSTGETKNFSQELITRERVLKIQFDGNGVTINIGSWKPEQRSFWDF